MISVPRQVWLLLALVIVDIALKMIMFHVLAPGQPIRECLACLILRVNPLNLGSHAWTVVADYGMQPLITGAIFSVVLAALLVALTMASRLTKRSVALSIVVAFVCALSFSTLSPSVEELPVSVIATATRAAHTILWLTIWALATSPLWKTGALLYAAAGLSNSLSPIFPPYRIVDFMWSSPLNRAIGLGVFNFADILWLVAPIVLTIALIVSALRRLSAGYKKGWPA